MAELTEFGMAKLIKEWARVNAALAPKEKVPPVQLRRAA